MSLGESTANSWRYLLGNSKPAPLPLALPQNSAGAGEFDFSGLSAPVEEPQGFWEATGENVGDFLNAPVIKNILDAISVGMYSTANIANNAVDTAEQGGNVLDYLGDIPEGIAQGVSGAFGNEEDSIGFGDVTKRIQGNMGMDVENGEGAGWATGIGLAGDIFLDPLTYLTLGVGKGITQGAKEATKFAANQKRLRSMSAADTEKLLKESTADESVRAIQMYESPGRYTDDFSEFLKKGDEYRVLDEREMTGIDKFIPRSLNSSRNAAEIQKVKEKYLSLNPEAVLRNPAKNRFQAFGAGFAEGAANFRLSERAGTLHRRDKRAFKNTTKALDNLINSFDDMTESAAYVQARKIAEENSKALRTPKSSDDLDIDAQVILDSIKRGKNLDSVLAPAAVAAPVANAIESAPTAPATEVNAVESATEAPTEAIPEVTADPTDRMELTPVNPEKAKSYLKERSELTDAVRMSESLTRANIYQHAQKSKAVRVAEIFNPIRVAMPPKKGMIDGKNVSRYAYTEMTVNRLAKYRQQIDKSAKSAGKSDVNDVKLGQAGIDFLNKLPGQGATKLKTKGRAEFRETGKISPETYQGIINYVKAIRLGNSATDKEAIDKAFATFKANVDFDMANAAPAKPMEISDDKLADIGIDPKDYDFVKSGGELRTFNGSQASGDVEEVLTYLRNAVKDVNGKPFSVAEDNPLLESLKQIQELVGGNTPQQVIQRLEKYVKSDQYKMAKDYLAVKDSPFAFGSMRTDIGKYYGYSGKDGENLSLFNISIEQAAKLRADERTAIMGQIADLPNGSGENVLKELDAILDEFAEFQSTKIGDKTSKRTGASTKGVNTGAARINGDINTHALMKIYQRVNKLSTPEFTKRFTGSPKLENRDAILMAGARYVDMRLREQGIDFRLNSLAPKEMRKAGEWVPFKGEPYVRLGMSDILEIMGPRFRSKFLLGNVKSNKMVLMPTQVLEFGEFLVRSATRLDANGQIDKAFVKTMANLALQGKFGTPNLHPKTHKLVEVDEEVLDAGERFDEFVTWVREFKNTLDNHTWTHNAETAARRVGIDTKAFIEAKKHATMVTESGVKSVDEGKLVKALDDLSEGNFGKVLNQDMPKEFEELIDSVLRIDRKTDTSKLTELIRRNLTNASLNFKTIEESAAQVAKEEFDRLATVFKDGSSGELIEAIKFRSIERRELYKVAPDVDDALAMQIGESLSKLLGKENLIKINELGKRHKLPIDRQKAILGIDRTHEATEGLKAAGKGVKPGEATAKQAEEIEKVLEDTLDLSVNQLSSNIAWMISPVANRFDPSSNKFLSHDLINTHNHQMGSILANFHALKQSWSDPARLRKGKIVLDNANLKKTIENVQEAILSGQKSFPEGSAEEEVYRTLSGILDTSRFGFYARADIPGHAARYEKNIKQEFAGDINHLLPYKVDPKTRKRQVLTAEEMGRQWLDWKFHNPYDFMDKLLYVQAKTAQEISMGAQFSKHFGSVEKLPGTAKFIDSSGKNDFFKLIDKELYYPVQVMGEIPYINRTMNESREVADKFYRNFITNVWDPVTSVLKMSQTSMKPGHHVMSIIGDGWRNFMATGSPMTREYKEMQSVLVAYMSRMNGANAADNLIRSVSLVQDIKFEPTLRTNGYSFLLRNGRREDLEANDLLNLMEKYGVSVPKHSGGSQEDLLRGDSITGSNKSRPKTWSDGIKKTTDKIIDHKIPTAINGFASYRDTYMRGALFMHFMRSRKFNNIEEAAQYASTQVKKWAPLAVDLANWESVVARRAIFYYTWIRGMTPRVLETLLTRPGYSTMGNKINYNLALGSGFDPNSVGDPYNEEDGTKLPSYMTDKVTGPMFQAFGDKMGVSLTHPTSDILNSWGAGMTAGGGTDNLWAFGKTVLGMSSPFIKTPVELSKQSTIAGDIPIESRMQYLNDMIGPARVASRMTGMVFDPYMDENGTGLFQKRTESQYTDKNGDGLIANAGSDQSGAGQELFNYLTGAGLTNYSTERLAKAGEFEQKDEQRAIQESAERK